MRITVITACYNSARVVGTALRSVAGQSHRDTEHIIVDGGSTDGTVEQIRAWAAQADDRVQWISEPDRGMYDAINKGIRMATGDVIGILNADDFFEDDRVLARVAERFEASDRPDAIYADIRFIRDPDRHRTVRYYSAKHWKPWMLRWGFMPPHPSVYIRREWFERLGLYKTDYHIAADYELLIRYLWKAGLKSVYVPACFVTMRMGGKSTKGWRSNLLLNREIVRGNRENGVYTNLAMLVPKYAFKVWEFMRKS
jgi:glycosyltransferase involved in cell wall biosynthesis